MKSAIVAALCIAAFAMRASGQTTTTYDTGIGHGTPPIPTVHSELPNTLPPLVITSDYYAHPKVLVLHVLNNSGKDITGYAIIIRHKNTDGTIDKSSWNEYSSDMLSVLIAAQMAKDPTASERTRQENTGNVALNAADTGIFVAGETRDMTLTGINSGSEQDIVAGVVFYVDGTYAQQDENAVKQMLTNRQGQLQAMKEADELIRKALADPSNDHPVAAVIAEMNKRRVEQMDKPGPQFPMDIQNLRRMQEPIAYGPMKGKNERERLSQYVEEEEKKVELMTPHCHLEIALKQ
jgi:hypothetical protein